MEKGEFLSILFLRILSCVSNASLSHSSSNSCFLSYSAAVNVPSLDIPSNVSESKEKRIFQRGLISETCLRAAFFSDFFSFVGFLLFLDASTHLYKRQWNDEWRWSSCFIVNTNSCQERKNSIMYKDLNVGTIWNERWHSRNDRIGREKTN